jgi:hypothetical protein
MVRAFLDYPVVRTFYPLIRRALISPDDAAAGLLRVALDPSLANKSGRYYERGLLMEPGAVARDDDAGRRLWSVTEELIGLSVGDR